MDHDLEVERRHIQAELFMNQATRGQQENPPCEPPQLLPLHRVTPPINNPANPVIINEYNSFNLSKVKLPIAPKWKNNE